jgi:hypothetical protein
MSSRETRFREADFALTLQPHEVAGLPHTGQSWNWTGWRRRQWPADIIRPGLRLYAFDKRSRCFVAVLEVTKGGAFTYRTRGGFSSRVQALTGWKPDFTDPHWKTVRGDGRSERTGIALRWKLAKKVHERWTGDKFPRLGWLKLSRGPRDHGAADRITVTWHDPDIDGYVDVFAPGEFSDECKNLRRTHLVRTPQGLTAGVATYLLTVRGASALLDYAAFPRENEREEMLLGRMRLVFSDVSRSHVKEVFWGDRGHQPFRRAKVDVGVDATPGVKPYSPARGKPHRRSRDVKERPGQRQFRSQLMLAYGGVCCISGCAVPEVLDGAHIDPYVNPSSDSPQNGLLLRKDLHCLLDAHLLAVEPDSRRVTLAASIRRVPEYRTFHGRRLRKPQSGYEGWRPDRRALGLRWRIFSGGA